ncbi:hypothetical protein ACGFIX_26985 [Nocardia salmonicida]|uniref:hypothetical protein n=1 Tax=Nocardia salmonicida TaxID=53431 RepID=UPI003715A881
MNLLATIAHDTSGERAVVMVTYDQQVAERTDRIITLRDGRIHRNEACARPSTPVERLLLLCRSNSGYWAIRRGILIASWQYIYHSGLHVIRSPR